MDSMKARQPASSSTSCQGAVGMPAFAYFSFIRDLYLTAGMSLSWKPVVIWKAVRSAASRSSQYSLLLSSQSIFPCR